MGIIYKELSLDNLHKDLLADFNRYQEVKNVWYPISKGVYELKYQPQIDDWSMQSKERKVEILRYLLERGGKVFGAFAENRLIGFAAIDGVLLGTQKQYIELAKLHVSNEYRGKHVGKTLFGLCAEAARIFHAKKLYIVGNESEESQIAYKKFGCVYTTEFMYLK